MKITLFPSGLARWRPVSWVLLLVLVLHGLPGRSQAAHPITGAPSVSGILNPDGTLRAGAPGTFATAGYEMSTDPRTGAPTFKTVGTGDENWQDGFYLPGTNGGVSELVRQGNNIYIGGSFTIVSGMPAKYIAKWDGTTWSTLSSGMDGPVRALAVDGSGNLYAGGEFTQAGGTAARFVAKWNGTTWSSLNTGSVNTYVSSLAVDNNNLYAGGDFSTIGGVLANKIAKWDGTAWSPLGSGTNGAISAVAVDGNGNLYVGGKFTQAGSVLASNVAKWNGTAWSPLYTGVNTPASGTPVTTLVVDGSGNLYVGGNFTQAAGSPGNYVAKWDGTAWSPLGLGTNGSVNALSVDGSGNVYAGGSFTQAGGTAAKYVAKWDGTAWSSLGAGTQSEVYALALDISGNGNVYAAGSNYVAKWNGTAWSQLSMGTANGLNAQALALAVDGSGNTYVAGEFTQAGGLVVNYVAKWDGTAWSALGTGMDNRIYSLAVDGNGILYAGGDFAQAGGTAAKYVAKWDGTAWSPLGTGTNSRVAALTVDGNGNVYAAGLFTQAGGTAAKYVAKWNGTAWSPLGAGLSYPGFAIAVDGSGNVYAGVSPIVAKLLDTNATEYVTKWDGSTWSALGTGPDGPVYALAVDGSGNLYAGGAFTRAGGAVVNSVAKWNGTAWSPLEAGVSGSGAFARVYSLAVDGSSNLYVGGDFFRAGSLRANYIAKWNGTAWSSLGTGLNNAVNAVAARGGRVYAGGRFTTVGDGSKVTAYFGIYQDAAVPTLTSLSPNSGPVSSTLTLNGTNLTGATTVTFAGTGNNTVTTGFTVNAAGTQLTGVVVPGGATTGLVTVTTPSGTSNGQSFTVSYPSLVVSTAGQLIAAGTYTSIIIQSGGEGTLQGATIVNTAVTVQQGGTLNTNCQPLSGAASFTLADGATLTICDPDGIAASGGTGAVQVSGTRSFSPDATYSYSGTGPQSTGPGLPAHVRSLTLTNASTVRLTAPTSVAQVLALGDGNFDLNGQALTLLSSSAGTALVVNSGAGVVQGTGFAMQRYIDPTLNSGSGYRHYSAPVSNTTLADLATSGYSPEISQAATYNSSATPGTTTPFPTLFAYDQSRLATATNNYGAFDKGFVAPTSLSAPMSVGRGYVAQIGAAALIDFAGTPTTGDQTPIALTRNAAGTPNAAEAGWQLVGNPYPSPLDWSLVASSDRPNLDGAMYVVQSTGPYAGGYRTYTNGLSTGTASNPLIASSQGFWVRVSAGQTSGSLTFRNAQRVTSYASQQSFQRTTADPRPTLRLELAGAGLADAWVAYAETGASAGFDAQYDAAKLANSTGLNLSSATATGNLAIDGQAAFTAATVLPLTVGVPAAGTYTLTAAALSNLPAGLTAYLHDGATGQTRALTVGSTYSFSVSATQAQAPLLGRFTLQFSTAAPLATAPAALAAQVLLYPNPAHGSFIVVLPGVTGTSTVQAELFNALGQVVRQKQVALPASGTTLTVPTNGLAAGMYTLRLVAGATTVTKRVALD